MNAVVPKTKIKKSFLDVLQQMRKYADTAPSLEEITKEVEAVRSQRYKEIIRKSLC